MMDYLEENFCEKSQKANQRTFELSIGPKLLSIN